MEPNKRQDSATKSEESSELLSCITANIVLIPLKRMTARNLEDEAWMATIVPFENQTTCDEKVKIEKDNTKSSSDSKLQQMPVLDDDRKAQFAKAFFNSVLQYKVWRNKQTSPTLSTDQLVDKVEFLRMLNLKDEKKPSSSVSGGQIAANLQTPIKHLGTQEGKEEKIPEAGVQTIQKAKKWDFTIPKLSEKDVGEKNSAVSCETGRARDEQRQPASDFDSRLKKLKKSVNSLQKATQSELAVASAKRKKFKSKLSKNKNNKTGKIVDNTPFQYSSSNSSRGPRAVFTSSAEEAVKFRKRQNCIPFQIVHAKPKKRRNTNGSTESQNKPKDSNDLPEGYWPVDKILKRKSIVEASGIKVQYLVRWVGNWTDSWEPEANLTPELVEGFKQKLERKRNRKMLKLTEEAKAKDCQLGEIQFSKYDSKVHKLVKKALLAKLVDRRKSDGRFGQTGFHRGLPILHIEHFRLEGQQCAVVRFQDHAFEELHTIETVLQYQNEIDIFI